MPTSAPASSPLLEDALREHFGFPRFNPGQREVIEHLMAGRSAAAVFATGAGKSLCYQLPAVLLPGLTLVVSPLIALMQDQITALEARGIRAHKLDSTLSFEAYLQVMDEVRDGTAKLLYVAPERFNNERFRQSLVNVDIALFAVDEAHCISEWGHNFRPDYLKLAVFAQDIGAARVLALTATATPPVLEDICRSLDIQADCAVRTPFYRGNLRLLTTAVEASERDARLLAALRERPQGSAIVYVTLQRTAEEVATLLARGGLEARAYHAGMPPEERESTQTWFTESDRGIVVATIAFGMGIDKPNIRYVYHYNLPKSLENYSQEIGRAGRDGAPSICETFACVDDRVVLENFVYGDTPTLEAVRGLVEFVLDPARGPAQSGDGQGDVLDLSLASASRELDLRALVLRTLLTYLELRGHIRGGTPFYAVYEFKPLMPSAKMLAQLDEGDRSFVRSVLAQSRKARVWFGIDADAAAETLGVRRARVVRVLDMLGDRQMIELRAKQVRHRYFIEARPEGPEQRAALAAELHGQMLEREASEVGRLREVVDLIGHEGCQVSKLGAHFGEALDTGCGHCRWCEGEVATDLGEGYGEVLNEVAWAAAVELRAEKPRELGLPRNFARFVCGVVSPALSKAKLKRHELFGSQAGVPFAEVLERARAV